MLIQASGLKSLGTFAVEADIVIPCFRVQLYILCNPGLVLVQQILLSLFSYHTIAQLALKTINICRQAAMCLVPALASHCQTSLCYTSLNQVGEKGRQLCPETKIKAGNYLKVNIFISYY